MNNRTPRQGDIYRHFKNHLYQILAVASHSETGEQMVVYQALYGDFKHYVRPLAMFISEVDKEKYPESEQTYRFELISSVGDQTDSDESAKDLAIEVEGIHVMDLNSIEEEVDPVLLRFLELETFEQKLDMLYSQKNRMTDKLIDDYAVALDIVIDEGPIEQRFKELENCLKTFTKYETERLR
ncbi:MAG: DUF1653 domain-containing protein [Lachnospiraceae bacterium]